jgi:putative acetyltransferase
MRGDGYATMTILVRRADPGDRDAIFAVHAAAFPSVAEARLVVALEEDGDAILSLVADAGGEIIGHLMFSRMAAVAGTRRPVAAALAPVAVAGPHRYRGIGTALIDAGLGMLTDESVEYVFVLGDPDYYERFGFDPAIGARFDTPYAGEEWMGLALGDAPLPKRAEVRHARAFDALAEQG